MPKFTDIDDDNASDKQVRFALDLLRSDAGVAPHTPVDAMLARKYNLPQGSPLRETLQSMSKQRISLLIDRLKDDDN